MNSKISNPNRKATIHLAALHKNRAWLWITAALVMLAAFGAIFTLPKSATAQRISNPQALEIISARYQGMADLRAAKNESHTARELAIISYRYQGMLDLYRAYEKAESQRALGILSQRYQARADSELAGWPARTMIALRIISERYQAQANLYATAK
jgi:hypothetical protein